MGIIIFCSGISESRHQYKKNLCAHMSLVSVPSKLEVTKSVSLFVLPPLVFSLNSSTYPEEWPSVRLCPESPSLLIQHFLGALIYPHRKPVHYIYPERIHPGSSTHWMATWMSHYQYIPKQKHHLLCLSPLVSPSCIGGINFSLSHSNIQDTLRFLYLFLK